MKGFTKTGINIFVLIGIAPYSVRMRENTDQKNFEYGHFSLNINQPMWFGCINPLQPFHCQRCLYNWSRNQIFTSPAKTKVWQLLSSFGQKRETNVLQSVLILRKNIPKLWPKAFQNLIFLFTISRFWGISATERDKKEQIFLLRKWFILIYI